MKGVFRVPGSFPVIITDDKIIRSGSEGISSSDDCHIDVGGILNFDF